MTTPAGIAAGTNSFDISFGRASRFPVGENTSASSAGVKSSSSDDSTTTQDSDPSEGSTFHSVLHGFYRSQSDDGGADSDSDTHKGDRKSRDSSDPAATASVVPHVQDGTQLRSTSSIQLNLTASTPGTPSSTNSDEVPATADSTAEGTLPTAPTTLKDSTASDAILMIPRGDGQTGRDSTVNADASAQGTASDAGKTSRSDHPGRVLTGSEPGKAAVTKASSPRIGTAGPSEPEPASASIDSAATKNPSVPVTLTGSTPADESDFRSVLTQISSLADGSQPDASAAAPSGDTSDTRPAQDNVVPTSVNAPPPRITKTRGTNPTSAVSQAIQNQPPAAQDATNSATSVAVQVATDLLAGSFKGSKTSDTSAQARATLPLPPFETHTTATAPSGETAFAARLTPAGSSSENPVASPDRADPKSHTTQLPEKQPGAQYQVSTDPADPSDRARTSAPIEQFMKAEANVSAPQPVAAASPAISVRSESTQASANPSPLARMEQVIEAPAAPQGSNRDITVRVPDSTDRGTDVRFLERGGEVRVMVRTSDAEMAQTLRGGLSDLVGRMEHTGIRAEVWRPGQDAPPMHSDPQNQSSGQNGGQNSDQKSDQHGSGSGRHRQEAEERENGRQDAEKPRWVEELETSLAQANNLKIQ